MKRILVIDDDQSLCTLLQRFLTKNGFEVETATTAAGGIEKFKETKPDLVICDYRLDNKDGNDVMKSIKVLDARVPFILITGYSDVKVAVAMLKDGAYDYISKPLIPDEILGIINKAIESGNQPASPQPQGTGMLHRDVAGAATGSDTYINTSKSPVMKELLKQVALVASTGYSVIIYGESGTGKEVIARTIHEQSERWHKPFVALDCGTLSRELAGSELFGHVKGSFTGAVVDKEGHFEMANGGTLFLDEVGNLSIDIQASLLRVIQERRFKRIGGTKEIQVDIRILVASNENLQESCKAGKFREDLYHRLNEFSLTVPPLRNRKEDIPLFAEYFLAKANRELNKTVMGFDVEVMELMTQYAWPGNLREMMNVVRRLALLSKREHAITTKMLPLEITESKLTRALLGKSTREKSGPNLRDVSSAAEYDTIMSVLKEVQYNKTKAAEILKIDRKTLYNKLKEHEQAMGAESKR